MNFLYRWTDNLTGMMYIGVHKGTPDDGYICSSKIMMPEYRKRPTDFTREIISSHKTYSDVREQEIALLTEVDAAKNPLYYNRHNGGSTGFNTAGRVMPQNEREMRSTALKGRKKSYSSWKGKTHSTETKQKIAEARAKQVYSEESRRKMSATRTGRKMSHEQKENIRQGTLKFHRDKNASL